MNKVIFYFFIYKFKEKSLDKNNVLSLLKYIRYNSIKYISRFGKKYISYNWNLIILS